MTLWLRGHPKIEVCSNMLKSSPTKADRESASISSWFTQTTLGIGLELGLKEGGIGNQGSSQTLTKESLSIFHLIPAFHTFKSL